MSDLLAGRTGLEDFQALVACGGFSYGDVLARAKAGEVHPVQQPRARRVRNLLPPSADPGAGRV
ncbi:phosphoribosylformylglycinamidine synthase [Enterobacter asburiae]|uniref:Phosphoribosylformylglycinamidine synthase n=1 Tax=Enterobacter asburiae TaxID=61645 RepID=A0A376FHP8_ENTAS|nr:phosphoribosylformylglycinamidine synthase [Enterobacter asburiae]